MIELKINLTTILIVYIICSIWMFIQFELIDKEREPSVSLVRSIFWILIILWPVYTFILYMIDLYEGTLKPWYRMIRIILINGKILMDPRVLRDRLRFYRYPSSLYEKARWCAYKKIAKHNNVNIDSLTEREQDDDDQ